MKNLIAIGWCELTGQKNSDKKYLCGNIFIWVVRFLHRPLCRSEAWRDIDFNSEFKITKGNFVLHSNVILLHFLTRHKLLINGPHATP